MIGIKLISQAVEHHALLSGMDCHATVLAVSNLTVASSKAAFQALITYLVN